MPRLAKQSTSTMEELEPMLAIDEVANILGISRRSLERLRVSKAVPEPDMVLGKMPRWKPETIRAWINSSKGK